MLRNAPVSFVVSMIIGATLAGMYFKGQVEAMRERIAVYEAKLSVIEPDEAVGRMAELNRNLDIANKAVQDLILQKAEDGPKGCDGWVEPICLSYKDSLTMGTVRQVLIHNQILANFSGVEEFSGFCSSLPKELQDDKIFVRPKKIKPPTD